MANRQLTGLERRLEGCEFVATDAFTVADILMSHLMGAVTDEKLLEPHPNIRGHRDRCRARPAWQRTIDRYCERVEPD